MFLKVGTYSHRPIELAAVITHYIKILLIGDIPEINKGTEAFCEIVTAVQI
jgi:hypothetical protein